MRVVDANVLLYAVNRDEPHHEVARGWLDASLSGGAVVGFSWIAMLAFVRLSTKVGLFPSPLTVSGSFERIETWLAAPPAVLVEPTARHATLVRDLLDGAGTGGNLVNDAHLGALSIEHAGRVVSFDRDFDRFVGVQWERPSIEALGTPS